MNRFQVWILEWHEQVDSILRASICVCRVLLLLSSLEEEEEEVGDDLKDTTEMRYPIKSMAVYELEAIQANASDPEPVKKQ